MSKKSLFKKSSLPIAIILSLSVGIITSVIMISLFAVFIVKNDPSPEILKFFWLPIAAISGAISGFTIGKIRKSKGYLWGLIVSSILSVIQIIPIIIINKLNIGLVGFLMIPITIIFGIIGGIIASNMR